LTKGRSFGERNCVEKKAQRNDSIGGRRKTQHVKDGRKAFKKGDNAVYALAEGKKLVSRIGRLEKKIRL